MLTVLKWRGGGCKDGRVCVCVCVQLALVWVTVTGCATLAYIKPHGAPPPPEGLGAMDPRGRPDPLHLTQPPPQTLIMDPCGEHAATIFTLPLSHSVCLSFYRVFLFSPPSLPPSVHHPDAETVKSDGFLHPTAFSSSSTPEECGTISSFMASVLTPYIPT